jgi:hypothetical protein
MTTDFQNLYPTGRLKSTSISELQDAIGEVLNRIAGKDSQHELKVRISSMEFSGMFDSQIKMSLTVENLQREGIGTFGEAPTTSQSDTPKHE